MQYLVQPRRCLFKPFRTDATVESVIENLGQLKSAAGHGCAYLRV